MFCSLLLAIIVVPACVSCRNLDSRIAWAQESSKQRMNAQAPLRRLLGKAAHNVYSNHEPVDIAKGIGIVAYVWRDVHGDNDGILLRWCATDPRLTKIIFDGPNGNYVYFIDNNMQKWHLEDAKTTVEYELSFAPLNSIYYEVLGAWELPSDMGEWLNQNTNNCHVIFVQKFGRNIGPIPLEDGAQALLVEKQRGHLKCQDEHGD